MANYRRKYARISKPSIDDVIDLSSLSSSSANEDQRLCDSNDMFNNHAASTSKMKDGHNLCTDLKNKNLKHRKNLDLKIASDVDKFLRDRREKKSRMSFSSDKCISLQKKFNDQSGLKTRNTSSEEYSEDQFNEHLRQCTKCESQIRKCLDKSQCLPYIVKTHSSHDKRRKVQRNNKYNVNDYLNKDTKKSVAVNSKKSIACKFRPLKSNSKYHQHHHHCDDENFENVSDKSSIKDENIIEATPLCTIL